MVGVSSELRHYFWKEMCFNLQIKTCFKIIKLITKDRREPISFTDLLLDDLCIPCCHKIFQSFMMMVVHRLVSYSLYLDQCNCNFCFHLLLSQFYDNLLCYSLLPLRFTIVPLACNTATSKTFTQTPARDCGRGDTAQKI